MIKFFFLGGLLFLALLTESLSQRNFWRAIRRPSIRDDSLTQRLFAVPYEENNEYMLRDSQEERREIEGHGAILRFFTCRSNSARALGCEADYSYRLKQKTANGKTARPVALKWLSRKKLNEWTVQRFGDQYRHETYCERALKHKYPESRPLCEEERKSLDIRELIQSTASNFIQSGSELDLRKYHLIPRKVDVIKCVSRARDDESSAVCKPENCKERRVDIEVFGRLKNVTGNVWEFIGTLSAVPVACECFVRWKPHKCSRSVDVFSGF